MDVPAVSGAEGSINKPVSGIALINALKNRAYEDGITVARLLKIIGISRSYWNCLGYGQRYVPALSRKVLQTCADYLAIPYINVLLLAEVITPEDFMRGTNADFRSDLIRAMAFISSDPTLSGFANDWQRLDNEALLLIVQLYERATGTNLLARSMDVMDGLKVLGKKKH